MMALPSNTSDRTNCFFNRTDEEIQKVHAHLPYVYDTYGGKMALPPAIIGLVLTLCFIVSVLNAMRKRRVSKKYYVLLINRSIGDALCCVSSIIFSIYILSVENVSRDVSGIAETVFMSSVWSAMVSYVSISILKFYAVYKPFQYRSLRMISCIRIIIFSWVIFCTLIAGAFTVFALVKIKALNEWSGCKTESCIMVMYRVRNMLSVVVYFFTLIVFFLTLLFLRRAESYRSSHRQKRTKPDRGERPASGWFWTVGAKIFPINAGKFSRFSYKGNEDEQNKNEDSVKSRQPKRQDDESTKRSMARQNSARFPFWKLSINVGTFAGFNLLQVIFSLYILLKEGCFFQMHVSEMMVLIYLIKCMLLMRIIVDIVISYVIDEQIRRGGLWFIQFLGCLTIDVEEGRFRRMNVSEESNSSGREGTAASPTATKVSTVTTVSPTDVSPATQF